MFHHHFYSRLPSQGDKEFCLKSLLLSAFWMENAERQRGYGEQVTYPMDQPFHLGFPGGVFPER